MATLQSLQESLNKAYLKYKIARLDIDRFKTNLQQLLNGVQLQESEEFHKNLIATFLKDTWYRDSHFINTKDRSDLVIHNGSKPSSPVGVLLEVKRPTNSSEMPKPRNLNTKAMQELLLYYLRERAAGNIQLRHLVITNLHEWFLFNAGEFEKIIAANPKLLEQFQEFEERRLLQQKTDFFYQHIASPAIQNTKLTFVYFDLRIEIGKTQRRSDSRLALLYKVLSPPHLLKQPFANDSNTLDQEFYSELLHIIGLTEVKIRGQKLIQRLPADKRDEGSLLENAIAALRTGDKLFNIPSRHQYGNDEETQLFNVALELAITWINRVLFLKLLEAQLVNFHHADCAYAFLDSEQIPNFHTLNDLFFLILALPPTQRSGALAEQFARVPYLNSSLFEISELERQAFPISALDSSKVLSLIGSTVLKDRNGRRRSGALPALQYLFEFLGAYDFGSEGGGDIQEQNKAIIGASVLGLIFEKINGYKEGSFFTPGFITTFMCRRAIRHAVLDKFSAARQKELPPFTDLVEIYNAIGREFSIAQANDITNQLRLCDPAVGSGHFLVSSLNEIIAIKSELGFLVDGEGRLLRNYLVTVENDELIVQTPEGTLFEYHPENQEAQRVQETLFHEKRVIIENCLFGGDINANSVKICRLRLWIELLKSAYYQRGEQSTFGANGRQLETLPNIDINIKRGDSLVSRFSLDTDVAHVLRGGKWNIESYLDAVKTYQSATSREEKRKARELIHDIRDGFRQGISANSPQQRRLEKLRIEYAELTSVRLFEPTPAQQKTDAKKTESLQQEIALLEREIDDIKNNVFFENATEWRYQFPEVLDEQGNFTGFDIVIGNPPYIRHEELKLYKEYFAERYKSTYAGTADLYVYFVERGVSLLKPNGIFTYILPNKWMRAGYGKPLRSYLKTLQLHLIADFGDLPVFQEATTYPCILELSKTSPRQDFEVVEIATLEYKTSLEEYVEEHKSTFSDDDLHDEGWNLSEPKVLALLEKLKNAGTPLGDFLNHKIYRGVLTGLNAAFVIDAETRARLIAEDPKSVQIIKPFLAGRDIKRYQQPKSKRFLILFKKGDTDKMRGKEDAENWLQSTFPAIYGHLIPYKEAAIKRHDKGDYWWELRACDYYAEFEKPKILYQEIATYQSFTWDAEGYYANNKIFLIPEPSYNLLGLLNSKLVWFYLWHATTRLRGDALAMQSPYILSIPVPPKLQQNKRMEELVQKVLSAKAASPQKDTADWEAEIDALVYELYGLTEEEIAVVAVDKNGM